jgi:hypothetical protein
MPTTTVRHVTERQFVGTDGHGQSVLLSGDANAGGASPSQMLLIASIYFFLCALRVLRGGYFFQATR